MKGIMLHCGANALTREQLAATEVPKPLGPRHFIRPFIEDVVEITHYLGEVGLNVVGEAYGLKRDKKTNTPGQYFGLMEVEWEDSDYALMIGLRGSYNQTLTRGMVVGDRVFVCDNLCFSGEIEMHTKQTTNISLRISSMLRQSIQRVPEMAEHQAQKFDRYKQRQLSAMEAEYMMIDFLREQIVNPSQMGKLVAEWDKPSHDEHNQYGDSVWKMHNAVTEAIKPSNTDRPNVLNVWDRTLPLTRYLDTYITL